MTRCFARRRSANWSCFALGPSRSCCEAVIHGLRASYQLDAVVLLLHDPDHEVRHLLASDRFSDEKSEKCSSSMCWSTIAPMLANLERPWLGPFRAADHALLLPGARGRATESLALIPLRHSDSIDGVPGLAAMTGPVHVRSWRAIFSRTWGS